MALPSCLWRQCRVVREHSGNDTARCVKDLKSAGWVKNWHKQQTLLSEALNDESPDVRVFASQALGFIADASAAEKLETSLACDEVPAVRLYAADVPGMTVRPIAVKGPS